MSETHTSEETRIVFGIRPVEELCKAVPKEVSVVYIAEGKQGPDMARLITTAKDRGIAVQTRPRGLVSDLAGAPGHQGVVAIAGPYRYVDVDALLAEAEARGEAPLLLILDGINDPQNLGALVRNAEVLGAHGVIVPEKESAPVAAGAVKASAGATERVKIARVSNLLKTIDRLREQNINVWGSTVGEGSALSATNFVAPTALVVGSESRGLREAVARRCTGAVSIPMRGQVASLNASAAGAIMLYEAMRQRTTPQ